MPFLIIMVLVIVFLLVWSMITFLLVVISVTIKIIWLGNFMIEEIFDANVDEIGDSINDNSHHDRDLQYQEYWYY